MRPLTMPRWGFLASMAVSLCMSCAESYHIVGSTGIAGGQHVQLRQHTPEVEIAQAKIVHGRFELEGIFDSVAIVDLYMDGQLIAPIVLEREKCSVRLDPMDQQINGGVLNTKLNKFLQKKRRLCHRICELQDEMVALAYEDGYQSVSYRNCVKDISQLQRQLQELEADFVINNQANVLGTYYFTTIVSSHCPIQADQRPLLRKILRKTSPQFRNRPTVIQTIQLLPELHLRSY